LGEIHLHITVNTDIGKVPLTTLVQHCDALCQSASSPPDAIILLCTNLTLHEEVVALEKRTNAMVIDSVYVTLWHTLQLLGVCTQPLVQRYGRLFSLQLPVQEKVHQ
jgi:maleate cis-trans isomerase